MEHLLCRISDAWGLKRRRDLADEDEIEAFQDRTQATRFLRVHVRDEAAKAGLRRALAATWHGDLTRMSHDRATELAGALVAGRELHVVRIGRVETATPSAPDGPKPAPTPVPPPKPGPPKPDEKAQKFKLVEVIEVVTQASEGVVVGAAPACKQATKKTLVTRTEKEGDAWKQFINIGQDVEGAAKRHPEYGRAVNLRARIEWTSGDAKKSLVGKKVHWKCALKTKGAHRPAALQAAETHGFFSAGGSDDVDTTTDPDGWTDVVPLHLPAYAGDVVEVTVQADEDETGKPSGTKITVGPWIVWRKFWYQYTHRDGLAVGAPNGSITAFAAEAADMLAATKVEFKRADVPKPEHAFYPQWMIRLGVDTTECAVIGGHNSADFYGMFKAEKDKPPKGHLILCDGQWDPKATIQATVPLDHRVTDVQIALPKWNQGFLQPALDGDLVVSGTWRVHYDGRFSAFFGKLRHKLNPFTQYETEGTLTDAEVTVVKGRSSLDIVRVALPDTCPDPAARPVQVELELRYGAYFAGESNKHQMLIVYKGAAKAADFADTISHEFGHGFGMVPRTAGAISASLPAHPKQYDDAHGGQGSHCSTDATLVDDIYKNGTCIMFHQSNPTGCKHKFCDDCDPYLRLTGMTKLE